MVKKSNKATSKESDLLRNTLTAISIIGKKNLSGRVVDVVVPEQGGKKRATFVSEEGGVKIDMNVPKTSEIETGDSLCVSLQLSEEEGNLRADLSIYWRCTMERRPVKVRMKDVENILEFPKEMLGK